MAAAWFDDYGAQELLAEARLCVTETQLVEFWRNKMNSVFESGKRSGEQGRDTEWRSEIRRAVQKLEDAQKKCEAASGGISSLILRLHGLGQ